MIPLPDPWRLLPRRMSGRGSASAAPLLGLAGYLGIVFLEIAAVIHFDLAWWAAVLLFFGLVIVLGAMFELLPAWLCGIVVGALYGAGIYGLFSDNYSPVLVGLVAAVVGGAIVLDGLKAR